MTRIKDGAALKPRFRRMAGATILCLLATLAGPARAGAFETTAPTAIMTDFDTGMVLYAKNPDQAWAPASLTKLMTVAVLFDELKSGRISMEQQLPVSERAWREGGAASGGSTMFLPLNSTVSVHDLLRGIIIQSGNDATIVVAEGIAGSVEGFVDLMNRKAKEIGLTDSHFTNPHGLPDPDEHVTMRDLVKLATYIIKTYPDYYPIFAETEFTFNNIKQGNRNPLIDWGADGLKTGHTSQAGYALVASAKDGGRRIVLAMSGMKSNSEREREGRAMMTYGLQGFETIVLRKAGETVAAVPVVGGVADEVPLVIKVDVTTLAPKGTGNDFTTKVVGVTPATAPVAAGTPVGRLEVERDGKVLQEVPLYTKGSIAQASFLRRSWDGLAASLASYYEQYIGG